MARKRRSASVKAGGLVHYSRTAKAVVKSLVLMRRGEFPKDIADEVAGWFLEYKKAGAPPDVKIENWKEARDVVYSVDISTLVDFLVTRKKAHPAAATSDALNMWKPVSPEALKKFLDGAKPSINLTTVVSRGAALLVQASGLPKKEMPCAPERLVEGRAVALAGRRDPGCLKDLLKSSPLTAPLLEMRDGKYPRLGELEEIARRYDMAVAEGEEAELPDDVAEEAKKWVMEKARMLRSPSELALKLPPIVPGERSLLEEVKKGRIASSAVLPAYARLLTWAAARAATIVSLLASDDEAYVPTAEIAALSARPHAAAVAASHCAAIMGTVGKDADREAVDFFLEEFEKFLDEALKKKKWIRVRGEGTDAVDEAVYYFELVPLSGDPDEASLTKSLKTALSVSAFASTGLPLTATMGLEPAFALWTASPLLIHFISFIPEWANIPAF